MFLLWLKVVGQNRTQLGHLDLVFLDHRVPQQVPQLDPLLALQQVPLLALPLGPQLDLPLVFLALKVHRVHQDLLDHPVCHMQDTLDQCQQCVPHTMEQVHHRPLLHFLVS